MEQEDLVSKNEDGKILEIIPSGKKKCKFCGEIIMAEAKKCRYCREFLDNIEINDIAMVGLEQQSDLPLIDIREIKNNFIVDSKEKINLKKKK